MAGSLLQRLKVQFVLFSRSVQTSSKRVLTVPVAIGAAAFFCGAVAVAWHARQHQMLGTQMSNGKGGFMTPADGYLIAVSLLLMGAGWCLALARLIRTGHQK